MTAKIATITNLAFQTFQQYSLRHKIPCNSTEQSSADLRASAGGNASSDRANSKQSLEHMDFLQPLCSSISTLTLKDVGFKRWWISDSSDYKAPVIYVHITNNAVFSMGIFILRPGSRIPLHDHPGMHGVLRVLYGSLNCRSFTTVDTSTTPDIIHSLDANQADDSNTQSKSQPFQKFRDSLKHSPKLLAARFHNNVVLTSGSGSLVLTPSEGNLHEITASNGSAVFIDILAPPYDSYSGARDCHYYEEVNTPKRMDGCASASSCNETIRSSAPQTDHGNNSNDDQHSLVYFKEISQPHDYWCDSAKYTGPL